MLILNVDEAGATLVDEAGVIKAQGHVTASDGAEFVANATADGGDIRVGLQFVGKVVNS